MRGIHEVVVQNNRVQYKFAIRRNLTILRGDSATGKSTLIDLIAQYVRDGENSGVVLRCDKPCIVLTSDLWEIRLSAIKDSIVFIDEDNLFAATYEFAEKAKNSDNYYVIVMRESLPQLLYSVDEIYTLKNRTKGYGQIKRLYTSFQHIYERNSYSTFEKSPDYVIVEDSHSGYQFFRKVFEDQSIPCISAQGKSNICAEIEKTPIGSNVLIIADGAAFGPEIERILAQRRKRNIVLFLPESFEWMILSAGLVSDSSVDRILENPADSIESSRYFSWERFFTWLLTEKTRDTYLQYNKRDLNPVYLQDKEKSAILKLLPEQL